MEEIADAVTSTQSEMRPCRTAVKRGEWLAARLSGSRRRPEPGPHKRVEIACGAGADVSVGTSTRRLRIARHLREVFTKLGIASPRELVAALRDR